MRAFGLMFCAVSSAAHADATTRKTYCIRRSYGWSGTAQRSRWKNPAGFLVQTAANIAVDIHRHERFTAIEPGDAAVMDVADAAPLQDEVLATRARLERVQQGLAMLPPRTREIFLMHRIEGAKYREIAARLNLSQSAVEKHIAKAALFLVEWSEGW